MHRPLEKHPIFPYVAWVIILGFGLFTASLAFELNNHAHSFATQTINQRTVLD